MVTSVIPDDLNQLESEVRSYSRSWPVVFESAAGSYLKTIDGNAYLDFFAGAGALNYGHNNPVLKRALLSYLEGDGITHSLDMMTSAKADLLHTFHDLILSPRALDYRVQFTGPTGTNAVEAALKLARKVTKRATVAAFTGAFHGVSLGSLAVTANSAKREAAGVSLHHTLRLPYCGRGPTELAGLELLDELLRDRGSGVEVPAAVILETVQGEGGVNLASPRWLRRLDELCRRWSILLIVDDVQMGCGRTGPFFSFETAEVVPDIVCLSKSISGFGLPLALLLIRPDIDVWEPGEHNGTFRGNNAAFVTATAALRRYWSDPVIEQRTRALGSMLADELEKLAWRHRASGLRYRGRGLVWGLAFDDPALAGQVCDESFARRLVIETSGTDREVVKLLPPLTIAESELVAGVAILDEAIVAATSGRAPVR